VGAAAPPRQPAIDAELSADATDAGERQAAAGRAAIPTIKGKRETWETLTGGKLTIATFRTTLAGFADQDQAALIQPYRPEYFAALNDIWRDWSSAMAQDFVSGAYWLCAVDEATIEATDAFLASSPEAPAALNRLLIEARDEVLRALRNQSRDRAAAELD
jgi:aminopeptidase N